MAANRDRPPTYPVTQNVLAPEPLRFIAAIAYSDRTAWICDSRVKPGRRQVAAYVAGFLSLTREALP